MRGGKIILGGKKRNRLYLGRERKRDELMEDFFYLKRITGWDFAGGIKLLKLRIYFLIN